MAAQGRDKLLTDVPKYGKRDPFRIMAYSEMMPFMIPSLVMV
jgi:hypothetical protein